MNKALGALWQPPRPQYSRSSGQPRARLRSCQVARWPVIGHIYRNPGSCPLCAQCCTSSGASSMQREHRLSRNSAVKHLATAERPHARRGLRAHEDIPGAGCRRRRGSSTPMGSASDFVRVWHKLTKKAWNKLAPFDKRRFQHPVPSFQGKEYHGPQWYTEMDESTPIAPGTKHPMRKLLHLAGRAWSFITANMSGEHFAIQHGGQVPAFLKNATELVPEGELMYVIKDIDGCYPNMPKADISLALRDITQEMSREQKRTGVAVPRRGKRQPCAWKARRRRLAPVRRTLRHCGVLVAQRDRAFRGASTPPRARDPHGRPDLSRYDDRHVRMDGEGMDEYTHAAR